MVSRVLAAFGVAVTVCGCVSSVAAQGQPAGGHVHYVPPPPAQAAQTAPGGAVAPRLQNLGSHTFPVSTRNRDAQAFMNQGLNLAYAFNHAEARRAFREAARLDPDLAMAYWGQALVLGPNINAADGAERGAAGLRAGAEGGVAEGARHAARAGVHRRARRALFGSRRGSSAAGCRVRGCDASCARAVPGRSRRRDALRRVGDGPAAVGLLAARRRTARAHRRHRQRSPSRCWRAIRGIPARCTCTSI